MVKLLLVFSLEVPNVKLKWSSIWDIFCTSWTIRKHATWQNCTSKGRDTLKSGRIRRNNFIDTNGLNIEAWMLGNTYWILSSIVREWPDLKFWIIPITFHDYVCSWSLFIAMVNSREVSQALNCSNDPHQCVCVCDGK